MKFKTSAFAKGYFVFLSVLCLVFGRLYYLLLVISLFYYFIYRINMNHFAASLKTSISPLTIHQGDLIHIDFEIQIKAPLPVELFYIFRLPSYIVHSRGTFKGKQFLRSKTSTFSLECMGNKRGIYEIGEVDINVNDPLGFFYSGDTLKVLKRVYVFPFLVSIEKLKIRLTDPIEGMKAKYQNNRDYTYIAGVRDYTSNDPVSMIHWKQTAHRGRLSVKEFDFTASKRIVIALNFYKKNQKFQDYAASIGASIAYFSLKYHLPFGAIVNQKNMLKCITRSSEYHLYEVFKDLSTYGEEAYETQDFISRIPQITTFGTELFYIDRDVNRKNMLSLMKIRPHFSRINIVLLPDETFVLPNEKPPYYYFKETEYFKVLKNSIETLAREGINVYPILGKDYLRVLEV